MSTERNTTVAAALLDWYRKSQRDLPWRKSRDPYAIWISEVMLQQTQVKTVIPYWERFLARWPTVDSLASADEESVRAAWSGLGYYRRAKLMRDAAKSIVADHAGRLPADLEALRRLPGFGPYTAGAVASIAFDLAVPAVDGNVQRVLARIHGIEGDVAQGPSNAKIWSLAGELATLAPAAELNQALMELGATVCSPRAPRCLVCPVRGSCVALAEGRIDSIPPPKKRAARSRLELTAIGVEDGARVVLEQRPAEGLLAGLWCLPLLPGHPPLTEVAGQAKERWGWSLSSIAAVGELTHVMTHRDLVLRLVRARARPRVPKGLRSVGPEGLGELGIPRVTVRALEMLRSR